MKIRAAAFRLLGIDSASRIASEAPALRVIDAAMQMIISIAGSEVKVIRGLLVMMRLQLRDIIFSVVINYNAI